MYYTGTKNCSKLEMKIILIIMVEGCCTIYFINMSMIQTMKIGTIILYYITIYLKVVLDT